jgi:DNA replication protein DnaC
VSSFTLAIARQESRLGQVPDAVDLARSAPLLILDDVGDEKITESSDVVPVIFHRHERQLPMIVTCGLGRPEVGKRNDDITGRRLLERATVIKMASK